MSISQSTKLKSERCVLRYISEEDIPHIFTASQVNGFTDGMLWSPPRHPDELKEPYRNNVSAWEKGTGYCFTIESSYTGEFIGRITIRKGDSDSEWDIGFWTHPTHQGKGYMSEVVAKILDFGFSTLKAKVITACYATWNKASERVLDRNGFNFVKHLPKGFYKNENWVEESLVTMTRQNWHVNSEQVVELDQDKLG